MRVIIQDTARGVALWAAQYIVSRIKYKEGYTEFPFVLGLPTGSTPLETYAELIRIYKEGGVSFANVVTFNMDEYVGLPQGHSESYHTFMWQNFFNHIDIKAENVHILDGNAKNLAEECRLYEGKISNNNGIDLFLCGIGADGHLAFNEPYSSLRSLTRVKTLTMDTRLANARFFNNNVEMVPEQALTVGVGTVLAAKEVVLLATGHGKARAIGEVVEGGVNHRWTASALQQHRRCAIVCDELAAYELRYGTYKYFREIEAESLLNV